MSQSQNHFQAVRPPEGPYQVGSDIGAGIAIQLAKKQTGRGSSLVGLACYGHAESEEERKAIANLFAAAPDLYEACIAALAYLAPPASKFKENREVAADMIRKAIAKAEARA